MTQPLRPFLLALLLAATSLPAQEDVLKPFRPTPEKPPSSPAQPEEEIPKAIPVKPFKPKDPTPKTNPADPIPATPGEDENIPKAKPILRPPPIPPSPETQPPPPKPTQPPQDEMPEPGDIIVKPGTQPTTPDQVQIQFADAFYARQAWRDAIPEYERFIQQYQRAPIADRQAAYYRLAECYRQTGALNNARANYETILSEFATGEFVGYAAYRLASLLYAEKDYRSAIPIYRRATVRLSQPTLIAASKFFLGRCLEATGQKTEAKITYEDLAKILESNPYRDASRLSVGRLLSESKRREEALAWLTPLISETPNQQIKADAAVRTAQLQYELQQYDDALKNITATLAMPESKAWKDDLTFLMFRALLGKKDYKTVIEKYALGTANGLSIESRLNILITVADSHLSLGQRDAAMAIYEQITHEFPSTPQSRDAAYARLRMLYENGDNRLIDEVNRFLTDNPTAPQVERISLMKAEALFKTGDFQNAAPIYEIIVKKSRGLSGNFRGEAEFKLAWCFMQLRQFAPAIHSFTSFIKENPTHSKLSTAYAQRGAAQMQLKQYTAAQKDFETLTTQFPNSKEREFGLENLALIHGQLGAPARMASTFEILLRDFPDTAAKAKANYWIGRTAFDRKDYKKAAPHLEAARKLDKEQFFERSSLAILASYYNMENTVATEREIEHYKAEGGKAETPADVLRWLSQKYVENGELDKAIKFLTEMIIRKEATPPDQLLLARTRYQLGKFKDAVDSYDYYLASTKDPFARLRATIEKADAQIALHDWDHANQTITEGLTVAVEGKFNGELRLRAAEIEIGRDNLIKAIQILESIPITLEDDDVNPRALDRAAALYKRLGNEEKARELDNKLRSRYPEYLQKKKPPATLAR